MFDENAFEDEKDIKLPDPNDTVWLEDNTTTSFAEHVDKLVAEGILPKPKYTLPLPYLSVTQVEMFLKCPKQFEYRYIRGLRKPPAAAAVQGSTVHKALEVGYDYVMAKEELPPLELALDTYNDTIKKNLTGEVIFDGEEDEALLRARGEGLLRVWHKEKLPRVNPQAVEKQFIFPVATIPVVGIIDLIDKVPVTHEAMELGYEYDGDTIIADNKVVGKAWSQADIDNSLQFTVYSGATGVRDQRADLYVKGSAKAILDPKSRAKGPHLKELVSSRNEADLKWMAELFESVAQAIQTGVFPPCSPSSWACNEKWCGYWNICRGSK